MHRILLPALIYALGASSLFAQSLPDNANKSAAIDESTASVVAKDAGDDAAWNTLQGQLKSISPKVSDKPASADDVVVTPNATVLVAQADLYRDFYGKNPKSKNVPAAKLKEAEALIGAEQLGDASYHTRAEALVAAVRKDSSLPADSRYVVAANWDHLPIGVPVAITPAVLRQYEVVERQLLKEFPDLPNAYEALLCLANSTTDDEAIRLAKDLDNKSTPDWIRKEAQAILVRQKLVGKDLKTLLVTAVGQDPAFKAIPGKVTVVYSWVPWNLASIAQIRDLSNKLPADAVFVGVCTDINTPRGMGVFEKETLPGKGFFDDKGQDGALASALGMTFSTQIYLADDLGVIRSVSLQIGTEQKLQTLLAK